MNNQYSTLVEAVEDLKKKGYTHNFWVNQYGKLEEHTAKKFSPPEVALHSYHRFEGNTNPDDMSIVYAVQTNTGLKGTVVDSFGTEGSAVTSEFMNHVEQRQFDD